MVFKQSEDLKDAWKPGRIAGIVSLYWVVSISMVFANKHLVGDEQSEEDITLFIACYQCCVVVAVIWIFTKFSRHMGWRRKIHLVTPRLLLHRNIVILSLTFVSGLLFNSLMLKHIGVAFYQVARSSTLIFVVILSHFILGKFIDFKIALCCAVVVMGYYLGASQEGALGYLPVRGICYGLAASLVIALGGTFMKKSEDLMNRDSLKLTFSYNFNSIFILVSLLLSTGQIRTVWESEKVYDPWFWLVLTCSGFLSLLIGIASAMQIQVTSPTTHHISISAKSVTQTVLAVLYFNQTKTLLWWLGNFLTIFGTVSYAVIKVQAEKLKAKLDIEVEPPLSTSVQMNGSTDNSNWQRTDIKIK